MATEMRSIELGLTFQFLFLYYDRVDKFYFKLRHLGLEGYNCELPNYFSKDVTISIIHFIGVNISWET